MSRGICLLPGVCLLLGGCTQTGSEDSSRTKPPLVIESSHVDPATRNLIAWWMTRREGKPKGELVPVLVTHPYGIFIQWPREEFYPDSADKRVFIFYDNIAKTSYQTRSFNAFLDVVAKQPRDITLLQFDTCTEGRDHMPKEQRVRLEKVLAAGNRTWAIDPATDTRIARVCYCEYDWDFVLPGDRH